LAFPTTPATTIQGTKKPCAQVPNRHRGSAVMTQEEIDILWQQAMRESVKDGETFTRYHFAKMVADKVSRELGLNYEDQETIEIEYRLKAQEDDVENTLHWHALNYRTALTENAQEMFEALENYVREKINENNQERKKLVGLTVEEIKECKFQSVNGTGWSTDIDIDQLAKNIESALKQKNGYAEEKNT